MKPPNHVAIIMDGNGRWGIKKKKSRNFGHKKGLEVVEKIISAALKKNIKFLTLYVFSTENWKRTLNEIKYLFTLLEKYIDTEIENLKKKKIKIKVIGDISPFPKRLKNKISKVEKLSIELNDVLEITKFLLPFLKLSKDFSMFLSEDNFSKAILSTIVPFTNQNIE